MNNFLEKPNFSELILLIIAYLTLYTALTNLYFFDYLYDLLFYRQENNINGIIFDFQVLIGGLLAFCAGVFVWIAARVRINYEREKEKKIAANHRIYYAKEAFTAFQRSKIICEHIFNENVEPITLDFILFDYEPTFLKSYTHIRFFDKNEISLIATLESNLSYTNMMLELFRNHIKEFSNQPFSSTYTEKDLMHLKQLMETSKKLENILLSKERLL